MADFLTTYKKTLEHEGGYVNDKTDTGGETYKGIARNFHADWIGWNIVDNHKFSSSIFPKSLESVTLLQKYVQDFYEINFWNKLKLNDVDSQELANELFDNAVNMGIKNSVLFLQKSLNLLNDNERLYNNINEDGGLGAVTLTTLSSCLNRRSEKLLLNLINFHQMEHYVNLIRKKEVYEKYIGWFNRVEINKG